MCRPEDDKDNCIYNAEPIHKVWEIDVNGKPMDASTLRQVSPNIPTFFEKKFDKQQHPTDIHEIEPRISVLVQKEGYHLNVLEDVACFIHDENDVNWSNGTQLRMVHSKEDVYPSCGRAEPHSVLKASENFTHLALRRA
mmetsp:Transcript_25161/g.49283  ORF Transcript_25161/g.49283 Transcript_25161/m.49283 type:complete len:139 (-) Transcript_25161:1352-1768(-)